MLMTKGGQGWPFVVFMDAKGDVISQFRPSDSAALDKAAAPVELLLKARLLQETAPSEDNQRVLTILEGTFAPLTADMAKLAELAKHEKVPAPVRAHFDAFHKVWPFKKVMMTFEKEMEAAFAKRDMSLREAAEAKAQESFYALAKAGTEPSKDDEEVFGAFWSMVMESAITKKDKALGMKAYDTLWAKYKDEPRAKPFFDEKKKALDALE